MTRSILALVPLACVALALPARSEVPSIGLWYTAWWTADDEFHHWSDCDVLPLRGTYGAGDPSIIAAHYAEFRDMGIDFLIMDDTNGCGNDGGRINDNIEAWFAFMDARPAEERIPICIGSGGEMRAGGAALQARAADYYFDHWARRPSHFLLDGKPLLLIDTDDNQGPGDFDDPRFAVRWAYNGDNFEAMAERQTWGWGCFGTCPVLAESMALWPGHRFHQRVVTGGRDPDEEPRDGGRLYAANLLHALKSGPRFITIADWNNYQEETAIEDSYSWTDPRGYCVPDLYRRITRAYSRLRSGEFVAGEYYRDEDNPDVYLYDGTGFVYQGAEPRWATVIVTPAGTLDGGR